MRRVAVVGSLFATLVACGSPASSEGPAAGSGVGAAPRVPGTHRGESTTARADYIGPDACGDCHPGEHAKWKTSLHRVMNARVEDPGAVIGRFDGTTLAYAGGTATFAREGATYTMTLAKGGATTRYRVTRTIGRKALQEYVGVAEGGVEVRLPFAWWPRLEGWYPQPYFDPWLAESDFDAYAPNTEPWAERCPWCHSTYPFEQRIARARASGVGHGLEQLVVEGGGAEMPARLVVEEQVTVGISCESCHLGGRAHAAGAPMHFDPRRDATTTFAEERADASIVNRVCTGCHSGPSPHFANGAATRNSSEGLDLAASACTTARCTDCHDPHTGGSDEAAAIRACVTCHDVYADPVVATSHAEHDGVTCLDCHMPRITMGVDRIVRSHRISRPSDPAMLEQGAPNACGLCHLDKSSRWVATELARRYGAQVALRGDRDRPLGMLYLASPEPAIRIVAADAFARTGAWERLVPHMTDELAHVRTYTQLAIERGRGRRLTPAEYDARGNVADRSRQVSNLGRSNPDRR